MLTNELKEQIIVDVLENLPKKYRHNQQYQQKKEFFLFRTKITSQLDYINVFVDKSDKFGFYDVEIKYYQSKPYVTSVVLTYTMKGISSLVKNNLKLLSKENEKL